MFKDNQSNIGIVILAAGDGKRMKTGIPKVMNVLHGKPLVEHVAEQALAAGYSVKPVVIVATNHTLVQDCLGDRVRYAIQEKQLGTGHAVTCAESLLKGKVSDVVVLYGDMPFITAPSIRRLAEEHCSNNATVTLMTVSVPDFNEWRIQFADFGRIIRNEHGAVVAIREKKDASEEELKITEVNTSYFCFKADWMWNHLKLLKNSNAQGEYYLVDLLRMAVEEGNKVQAIPIDPKEAIGINTKEHLEMAARIE